MGMCGRAREGLMAAAESVIIFLFTTQGSRAWRRGAGEGAVGSWCVALMGCRLVWRCGQCGGCPLGLVLSCFCSVVDESVCGSLCLLLL